MTISQFGNFASSRSTFYESFFDKEWFIYLFHSSGILADCCGNSTYSDRTTLEFIDDGQQKFVVYFIQTELIYIKCFESKTGYFQIDCAITTHLCEIAHTTQQSICNTRGATRTGSYLTCCIKLTRNTKQVGRTQNDSSQRL